MTGDRYRAALPLLLALLAQAGCLSAGQCVVDSDCAGGGECTRTGECVQAGGSVRVTVSWTVNGDAPTPGRAEPCTSASIDELEIRFRDRDGESENYRPVPCELGRTVYDKMPPRFDSVELRAYGADDELLASAEAPLTASRENDVELDLAP